jgi:hypothetical protein
MFHISFLIDIALLDPDEDPVVRVADPNSL